MINKDELIKYKKKAEVYLVNYNGLDFNHYGIQAKDTKDYEDIVKKFGNRFSEVNFRGRRISTLKTENGIIKVYEPKPDQFFSKTFIDHVAYISDNFNNQLKELESHILTKFDVGSTHGFKINPAKGIIIEIRNNDILDSVKDFSS